MKFLLTNDDGIDAPGLMALYEAVRFCFGDDTEIVVVAPDRIRSECGHSITTRRPLRLEETRAGWFSVDGTPVDCVRVAIGLSIAADADIVLSGVNAGANLGVDLLVSGTFAAAREAALQGFASIACSHYRHPDVPKTWEHVGRWLKPIFQDFAKQVAANGSETTVVDSKSDAQNDRDYEIRPGMLWNVNLPAIDPRVESPPQTICPVDRCIMNRSARLDEDASDNRVQLQSDFHSRPRKPGTDVDQCFRGRLTISKIEPHLF